MLAVNFPLIWTLLAMFAALSIGTLVRMIALRKASAERIHLRMSSLRTWWVLAGIMAASVLMGAPGIRLLLLTAAILALREFLRLIGREQLGLPTVAASFAAPSVFFLLSILGFDALLRETAPVAIVAGFAAVSSLPGVIHSYVRTTAAVIWAQLLFVYCLSHACWVMETVEHPEPAVGRVGWFLFLVLLTEMDDIMQALIGRRFGRVQITPRVSPSKTAEGFLGGVVFTMMLGMLTAPWLTTFMHGRSTGSGLLCAAAAGLAVALAGFIGDINMSAVKRDVGVKDGSRLLPGQGGMIDRIDSLTLSAPVFYYFVRIVS